MTLVLVSNLSGREVVQSAIHKGQQHIVQKLSPFVDEETGLSQKVLSDLSSPFNSPGSAFFLKPAKKGFDKFFADPKTKPSLLLEFAARMEKVKGTEAVLEDIVRVADELLMNAVAYGTPDKPGSPCHFWAYYDERSIVIGCADHAGSLDPKRLLSRIEASYSLGVHQVLRRTGTGAGIGCFTMFELGSSLTIVVVPKQKTLVACRFPLHLSRTRSAAIPKSLHTTFTNTLSTKDKAMDSLKIEKSTDNGMNVFTLSGSINEDVHFNTHPLKGLKSICFDLNGITSINSCGVREWIRWMQEIDAAGAVRFTRCPKIIVDQMNLVEGFIPKQATVDSFYLPFYCENCETVGTALLRSGSDYNPGQAPKLPTVHCEKCKQPMVEDIIPSRYFRFLRISG